MKKALTILVLAVVAHTTAAADTTSAVAAGKPQQSTAHACFHYFPHHPEAASVANVCPEARTWLVPLTLRAPGRYTVVVRVRQERNQANTWCGANVITQNGTYATGGTMASSNSAGDLYQNIQFTTANVPSGGTAYVWCTLAPNSATRMLSVDWY